MNAQLRDEESWKYFIPVFLCACFAEWKFGEKAKGERAMKVRYKGVSGKLVNLELVPSCYGGLSYKLTIYDSDNDSEVTFKDVKISDIVFESAFSVGAE